MPGTIDVEIRRATHDDYEGVTAFTDRIWTDRGGDYISRIYHDWIEGDDETAQRTFLADAGDDVAGIVQAVMLSEEEAWFQGMRVNPDYRRMGISRRLNEACFEWARDRGATVGRLMVFSWNAPALGASRAVGFDPVTEFRWAHPNPDPDAGRDRNSADDRSSVASDDPAVAWRYWTDSDAREHLRGVALDPDESWAVRELTRADLDRLADETAVVAVEGDDGAAGLAYRTRTYDRTDDETGETTTWAEYGVGAWADVDAARTLFAAVARDAAAIGADETRVLIPETVDCVSDAAYAGVEISEEPDFVLGIDLVR